MNRSSGQNKQLLISFCGIDGAGKSTQISLLRRALKNDGHRVELITFWDDVVALKRFREDVGHKVFKGDKGVGSPEAPIRRRDKNVQSPFLTLCRMALYALDILSLRRTIGAVRREENGVGADVIICDRFIYDELANLKLYNMFTRFYVDAMLRLAPKPDLAFVLDANPDAAFARKPEYPLEFLHSNREAYLNLARIAGMTIIPPAPINEAHQDILRHIEQKRDAELNRDEADPVMTRKPFAA